MKFAKLRGRIREKYGNQEPFAEDMGMSSATLSAKLNGKRDWSREEMEKACTLLDIPLEDAHEYFF